MAEYTWDSNLVSDLHKEAYGYCSESNTLSCNEEAWLEALDSHHRQYEEDFGPGAQHADDE